MKSKQELEEKISAIKQELANLQKELTSNYPNWDTITLRELEQLNYAIMANWGTCPIGSLLNDDERYPDFKRPKDDMLDYIGRGLYELYMDNKIGGIHHLRHAAKLRLKELRDGSKA